jgi:phage terminase large subunit-like protein
LWDLHQAGLKGEDPGMFFFWSHENLASWITEGYLAQQRRRLPDSIFRRLHRNEWTSGTGGLFRLEEWDACVAESLTPLLPNKDLALSVGVDASIKRDRTAVVATYFDPEQKKVRLALNRWWQPTPAQPLNIEETVEAYLLELHDRYRLHLVRYDPYQFHRSATTLAAAGLPMEEFPQSTPNLTAMGQNLFELVKGRNLAMYPDPVLRDEASRAIAEETTRGWKISKAKSGDKIDQIVALAMATLGSLEDTREPGDIGCSFGPVDGPDLRERDSRPGSERLPETHNGVTVAEHAQAGCPRCVARVTELRG